MGTAVTVYGDPTSGNCLKVKWVADVLEIPTVWNDISVVAGEARTPEFLRLSPAAKVPIIVLGDGRVLSESNAIILYLADGSRLIPEDPFERGRMLQWMFWEQYSHEPYIAGRRFQLAYLKRPVEDLDPKLQERGEQALRLMEETLERSPFMAGEALTLADIALVAYTRMAGEGGFSLAAYPAIRTWITSVESGLGIGAYGG
jgi:glutathione S-transferase